MPVKADITVEFKITGECIELVLPSTVLGKCVTGWWIGKTYYPVIETKPEPKKK
jgi:hypothetical protein